MATPHAVLPASAALPALLLGLALSPGPALAANQFANAGFESGDLTGWAVAGLAESGVATDGTPLTGTQFPDNQVNVRTGAYACWAKLAQLQDPQVSLTLSQDVSVTPNTLYEISFWASLGTALGDAGRFANITVNGVAVFDTYYEGPYGTAPADYGKVMASYWSGTTSGTVSVAITLHGSGDALAGFSFDDFSFDVAANQLVNPGFETCSLGGWIVDGLAVSGAATDGTPIPGTIYSDSQVNVHTGTCAAWARLASSQTLPKHFILSQNVVLAPNTLYQVSFWASLGTNLGDAGRFATLRVGNVQIYGDFYPHANGLTSADFAQVNASYWTGTTSGQAVVTFYLTGSGDGYAGFSFDDFQFTATSATPVAVGPALRAITPALLGAPYPNPFRSVAAIPYRVPAAASRMTLGIHDLSGRRVRLLTAGRAELGSHVAHWDGMGENGVALPSGMYYVVMRVGMVSASRRLVLLK